MLLNESRFQLPMLPLSALQLLLFGERQYAIIHLEQVWAENRFTVEFLVKASETILVEDRTYLHTLEG